MNDQAKGLLITLFGVLFVVPDSLFVRLIPADAVTIAFWRLILAGGLTGLWLFARKGIAPFRAVLGTGIIGWTYIIGVGGAGALFVFAVSLTSVANVVFIIASLPVFAALFSRIFLSEPFSTRTFLTIAAVTPGLAVIAYGSGETANAHLSGDLLALGVSAMFAAALTAARHAKGTSMVAGVAMGYVLAALLIAPWAAPFEMPASAWPLVVAHGGFILISSVLLALGPRYITSAEVGLLVLLESVLAPILAWLVVHEDPGPYALIGGAIVIGALFLSNLVVLMRRRA
ncbi:MAG: drug/metabolite transporter (DMT)-like permease [Sulfitobacter sp.]|jgi:drug/metabolite transporter (DMT)-like permease